MSPGKRSGVNPLKMMRGILASRVLGHHRPLLVNIEPTHRCNLDCVFCDKASGQGAQMGTADALALIDDLARAGTLSVCFDGGEPLVHPGLGEMVARAKGHGMRVALSTNGTLLKERADELADVDVVKVSLDGPEEVHDAGRGNRAFVRAVEGVRAVRELGIPVSLRMTLARHNLSHWSDVLALATELGTNALFQPAIGSLLDLSVPPSEASPEPEEYRSVIDAIIRSKRSGAPVANELACLRMLRRWPLPAPVPHCAGGRIEVAIGPEGGMYPCGRVGRRDAAPNVFEVGVAESTRRLVRPEGCANCWCTLTLAVCVMYGLDFRLVTDRWWGGTRGAERCCEGGAHQ